MYYAMILGKMLDFLSNYRYIYQLLLKVSDIGRKSPFSFE